MKKRRIAVILGSDHDLKNCGAGFSELSRHRESYDSVAISIRSHLRHPGFFGNLVLKLADSCDVIVVGAGMSHHPAAVVDSILRRQKCNTLIPVIGVAFEIKDGGGERSLVATELSLTESPDTQVVYKDSSGEFFVGSHGFFRACQFAIFADFPKIIIPPQKLMYSFYSLEEAMNYSS